MGQSVSTGISTILLSTGRTGTSFVLSVLGFALFLVAFVIGLRWGAEGVAAAYAIIFYTYTAAYSVDVLRLRRRAAGGIPAHLRAQLHRGGGHVRRRDRARGRAGGIPACRRCCGSRSPSPPASPSTAPCRLRSTAPKSFRCTASSRRRCGINEIATRGRVRRRRPRSGSLGRDQKRERIAIPAGPALRPLRARPGTHVRSNLLGAASLTMCFTTEIRRGFWS